ncbi:MAG: NDP-sugar synthase [Nitrososphaeraceae archaeon]
MKAVLLAGGKGQRAKPFSDYIPKALIPVKGRPIIDHIVRYLDGSPLFTNIIIVCEFDLWGKQIINYFEGKEKLYSKEITFIEDKKNGTGGALLKTQQIINTDEYFLVWFSDNLCALNIEDLVKYYQIVKNSVNKTSPLVGIVVSRKYRYEETGRLIIDEDNENEIKEFIEKPTILLDSPEGLGIYLFTTQIFKYLNQKKVVKKEKFDLSHDILASIPKSNGKLFSYMLDKDQNWIDIQSPVYAERNNKIIEKIILQMT